VRRAIVALAACVVVFLAASTTASASPALRFGIYDEAQTLFSTGTNGFDTLKTLKARILRLNLYWYRVSPSRPQSIADPFDPSYDWSLYDRAVRLAAERGIRILFSIWGTPDWANGGRGPRNAPTSFQDLEDFAEAAAHRYSGHQPVGAPLPLVDLWMAWNEPNSPNFLQPQSRRQGNRFVPASPGIYARICNAVYRGVHTAGEEEGIEETVACGVTAPRGNNIFRGKRPSISPILFLRGMKAAGATFDVYAHHPYNPAGDLVAPNVPPRARTTVTMGNINTLIRELNRLYGRQMRLWITEYGYQTNPPDRIFGVSLKQQAAYLRQAYRIARRNPRIDMLLWFLLRDEPAVGRWQSGLITFKGKRKPAFAAYRATAP
jgi:Glycosyl hydrolase catalytic core